MLESEATAAKAETEARSWKNGYYFELGDQELQLIVWKASDGLATLPVLLTDVIQEAAGMEGGMQGAIKAFDGMFTAAAQSTEGLSALQTAFQSVGLSFDTTTGKVTDGTGKMVADLQVLGEGATSAATTTDTALLAIGASGDAARIKWAEQILEMSRIVVTFENGVQTSMVSISGAYSNMANNVTQSLTAMGQSLIFISQGVVAFVRGVQSSATTVSGAFNNMATNINTSLVTAARGITTFQGIITNLVRASQSGATTVSGAFNNMSTNITSSLSRGRSAVTTFQSAVTTMASQGASRASSFASSFASAMSRVQSSAGNAASAVRNLQSAINSLRSKTVVITTVYRQVIQRVYAAHGGAFVASSPTKIGPLNVSEFGQKELVTVTPLENPSGQTITGPGMQVSTSGPGAKAFARSGEKSINLGDVVNMLREVVETNTKGKQSRDRVFKVVQPQIITLKLEGKELTRFINKNLFELSDALI